MTPISFENVPRTKQLVETFDYFSDKTELQAFFESATYPFEPDQLKKVAQEATQVNARAFLLVGYGMWELTEITIVPYHGKEQYLWLSRPAIAAFFHERDIYDLDSFNKRMGLSLEVDFLISWDQSGELGIDFNPILDQDGAPFLGEYGVDAYTAEQFMYASGTDARDIEKTLGEHQDFVITIGGIEGDKKVAVDPYEFKP